MSANTVTYVDSLKNVITQLQKLNKSDSVTEKLIKAQELVEALKNTKSGVLQKFRLDGQVALVTGGGQGIGRAFAIGLGEAGCKVAVADLELDRAEAVVAELEAKGVESFAIKVDVSKKTEVEEMVHKVLEKFGDLHIACNNAGIHAQGKSEEFPEYHWKKIMDVNLNGVFYCCQAEAKHMLKKGYGKIINTGSISATIVNRPQHNVAYSVSKAGVLHMSKTLGTEWCERGVYVNCLSPGSIDTPLGRSEALLPMRKIWVENTPQKRVADAEELVGALIYLASPLSNYTTGCNLLVDGGYTCW